jgi:hypothetical protein
LSLLGSSADREIQRTLMELLNQMDGYCHVNSLSQNNNDSENTGINVLAAVSTCLAK